MFFCWPRSPTWPAGDELVADTLPRSAFVSSDGLTSKPDNAHFNTESLWEFGRRYARVYLHIVQDPD